MPLGLNDVCSLIQQDVVAFNYGGELVQDGVVGQVDLIEKDPVSGLHALDQRSLDELEYESTA